MKRTLTPFIILLFLSMLSSVCQAQFVLKGQYIPRPEYRHGYRSLAATDQEPAFFIAQRTRLMVGYTSNRFRLGISFQDVRTWGSTSQLNITDPYLSLHEAWGELFLSENFSLKMGRQELDYDDERIFGPVDWTLQARSHDVLLLKFKKANFTAHGGIGYNQDRQQASTNLYTVPFNYKTIQFVWLNQRPTDRLSWSLLFLNNGLQYKDDSTGERDTRFSQMVGGRVMFSGSQIKINGNVYHQLGEDVTAKKMNANEFALDVTFLAARPVLFTLGYEYLSGNSQVNVPKRNEAFTPFYGTNHKFNGFMDYFYVANHINSVGLSDVFLKISYIKNKQSIALDIHSFYSAADILDTTTGGAMNSTLGTEIDLTFKYKMTESALLQAGYSQMFATSSMQALKGGDYEATQNWGYVMLKLTPTIFEQKAML